MGCSPARMRPGGGPSLRWPGVGALVLLILGASALPLSGSAYAQVTLPTRTVPIAVSETWVINGVPQSVVIRGRSVGAPILIWVGDLSCETPIFRKYQGELERNFTVVYWCQRYSGSSFDPFAPKPAQLSLDDYVDDLDVLVGRVSHRLGNSKVILVGHSSGTILALRYLGRHPQKVSAYVGVGQVVDAPENLRRGYAWVVETARRRRDAAAESQLQAIGPPPYRSPKDFATLRTWIIAYGGAFHNGLSYGALARQALLSGYASWRDVAAAAMADGYTAPMAREAANVRFEGRGAHYDVPIYLMEGRYDRRADPALAAEFLSEISAPAKGFVSFAESAHSPPFEEPVAFRNWLVRQFRPLPSRFPASGPLQDLR